MNFDKNGKSSGLFSGLFSGIKDLFKKPVAEDYSEWFGKHWGALKELKSTDLKGINEFIKKIDDADDVTK